MEPFVFQQTRRGAVLTKCTHDAAYLTVPAEWNGQPVCEIGSYAFSGLSALRRVALPKAWTPSATTPSITAPRWNS